jgi:hypothetical protein
MRKKKEKVDQNEIEKLIAAARNAGPVEQSHVCKYCKKAFVRENTLASHMCELKRRHQQKDMPGARLGYQTWLRFFELTQGSAKHKTYDDFVDSPYYLGFTKFGIHINAIRAVNPQAFIEYVLKNNKKLDHWCQDRVYSEYLFQYLRTESAQSALERSIREMENWAEENSSKFDHFFKYAPAGTISSMLVNGRISPWVIYNCDSGSDCLGKMTPEQHQLIWAFIDPDYWTKKFQANVADVEWTKHILKEAGF